MPQFMNLNVPHSNQDSNFIEKHKCLGFERLALNQLLSWNKKIVEQCDNIIKEVKSLPTEGLYSRLSLEMSEISHISEFRKLSDKEIDILSLCPTNDKLFLNACKDLDFDLISFDMTQRLSFIPKRTAINLAIEKGISFEIDVSGMMRDHSIKRNVISNGNLIVDLCRGKNIVISNGSADVFHFKGPYDLINLAYLFGMNKEEARNSITNNPNYVIKHSLARKFVKSVALVEKKT